jgi:hypothetical protein
VDNPQFLEAWFEKIQPYRVRAIAKAMRAYINEEERFPVPGTLIPRIKQEPNALENSKGNNTCD